MKVYKKKLSRNVVLIFLIPLICIGTHNNLNSITSKNQADSLDSITNIHTSAPAISILVYSQYADESLELPNTMQAINNSYGTNYYYENLTDYTNLDVELPGHDILLIPEQEKTTETQLKIVGNAWADNLSNFVNNGGIIILMDYNGGSGGTFHIYNASGLMKIDGITDIYNLNVSLVAVNDPLAAGVSSTFIAPDGSLSFNTTEGTTVVDDGINPMVVHKVFGNGHIVLLGCDFWEIESNCSTILGNAIQLAVPSDGGGGKISFGNIYIIFILISVLSLVALKRRLKFN